MTKPYRYLRNDPFFSSYSRTVHLDDFSPDAKWLLDLGRVDVIAEVKINGSRVATLWAPPFRVDITPFISPGLNQIDVSVTNTWFNRLVYDAALPEAMRKTWTISAPAKNSPIKPAGLTGPVMLRKGELIPLN